MKQEQIRVCVDRVIPDRLDERRVLVRKNLALLPPGVLAAAVARLKTWHPGDVLRCRFLTGSKTQRTKVEARVHQWEQVANITFKFVSKGAAEIRIGFQRGEGSWSAVGTDCLVEKYFPLHQPTLNLGWIEDDTEDREYDRVVLHEFGHALGMIHEHQNPAATLKWNKAKVYAYFAGPPNYWSREDIDHNIFERYDKAETQYTKFDPKSIMLYQFPAEFFEDGQATSENTALSATDKKFIADLYPRA
jgi:hypothetical protein